MIRMALRHPLITLFVAVALGLGGTMVWNMYLGDALANTSAAMSKPKHKKEEGKRHVVLQMHWSPPAIGANLSWNLGTVRGGSGVFKPGTLQSPWRRSSHAKPGASITFGWYFIPIREPGKPAQTAERFKWELWIENPSGELKLYDFGNGPLTPSLKGPYIIR